MDAIRAFRIAVKGVMSPFFASGSSGFIHGAVIHPVAVGVLENGDKRAGVALPRLVERDDHLARHGLVEDPLRAAFEAVHQNIVEKQFAAVADVHSVCGQCRTTQRGETNQEQVVCFHGWVTSFPQT